MEIFLPDNIFARILSSVLTDEDKVMLKYYPSSLLSKNVIESKNAVALIPTLDLINHKDFFVSQSIGISFYEPIGNSYIYFNQDEKNLKEIVLAGDVSTNEAILTKILFSETYGIDVQLTIEKPNSKSSINNRILVGDRNFSGGNISSAIGFTEEIVELISAPYINFMFVSESETALKVFQSKYQDVISNLIPSEVFENMNDSFSLASKDYLAENFHHVVFNFDEQDFDGIKRLLELPYYHGIIQEMMDVKFV